MMNSNSLFNVKNGVLFLLLISILLSFTNPDIAKKSTFSHKETRNSFNPIFKGLTKKKEEKVSETKKEDFLLQTNHYVSNQTNNDVLVQHDNFVSETILGANLKYNSTDNHEGIIGSPNKENWNDDPADNLYNVNVIHYDKNKQYTLVYSVKGVTSASSVTRSINQSFSLGGYIATKGNSWTIIKEDIDPTLINKGNNQILFNTINSKGFYLVKDVSIIESTTKHNSFYKITSNVISNDKIYIKGYFNEDSQVKTIEILGNKVILNKNEFEYFDSFGENQKNLKLKFTKIDGSIIEESILKSDTESNAETNIFIKPEERIIETSNLGTLIGLRTIDLPPVESSITNLSKDFFGYRFRSFTEEKKTIHLPYDKNKIPKGFHENDIATFGFNYLQKKWQRLKIDSIDIEKELVILTVEGGGDTDYVNGIIKNPESPETASFAPTTTNDIPVANPTSKINMISPPTANQQGSANVSYPIEIPAGINGFQPNISINYNSDSKNGGWAGIGWDIPLESIEIDTRWGVPEFNPNKESEIYTINGEQLVFDDTYLPNKTPSNLWIDRVSGDKQFYFRNGVKTGVKIIRIGSGTEDYTWQITDTDGTVKIYDISLTDGASAGNKIKWYLHTVTDIYGNIITYNYNSLTKGTNGGKNKYLKEIIYSKNNTIISFYNRNSDRNDITSSYKLGTKISDFKLLEKIIVKRANKIVRQYELSYIKGRFEKELLSKIIQKNSTGEAFNEHTFSYSLDGNTTTQESLLLPPVVEDEEQQSAIPINGSLNIFSPYSIRHLDAKSDGISSFSITNNKLGVMGGSETKSQNYRGAITIGFSKGIKSWFLPIFLEFNKNGTAGLNGSYSESESLGKTELMDLDGDGLPDKVFFQGNQIKYRKNEGIAFSNTIYTTGLLSSFSKSGGNASSYGFEVSLKKKIGAGITYSKSKSYVSSYFSDVNADGLIDYVNNKEVYFNKMTPSLGAKFEYANTINTPNAILNGTPFDPIITPSQESKLMSNIVRVWEAPVTGTINIFNDIELKEANGDGVEVWIEKGSLTRSNENNNASSVQQGVKIELTVQNEIKQLNIPLVPVIKGQRIYIIANSKNTTNNDKISINSTIKYATAEGFNISQLNKKDMNGNSYFEFNAENSYLENSLKGNAISEKGSAKITWENLTNQIFSDDINFRIYKFEKKASDTTSLSNSALPKLIFYQKLKRGQSLSNLLADENLIAGIDIDQFQINSTSTESDPTLTFLYFDVSSDTNVAWDKIKWVPKVSVLTSESPDPEIYDIAVQYQAFSEVVKLNNINPNTSTFNLKSRYYPKFTSCFDVKLYIPVSISNANETEVTFAIKFKNYSSYGTNYEPTHTIKKKVKIIGNYMEIPYIDNYELNPTFDSVEYEIFANNYDVAKYLADINPYIEIISSECYANLTNIRPNYYSFRSQGENHRNYNLTMGQMWQGWGAFSYNANNPNYINQGLKEVAFYDSSQDSGIEPQDPPCVIGSVGFEECMLDFLNNEVKKRYFTALDFNPKTRSYQSPLESTYINGGYMLPYAINEYLPAWETSGEPTITPANPMAIVKHSEDISLNLYGRFGPVNGSGGWSRNKSSDTFMDVNGDMYPDVIQGDYFQITDQTGKLVEGSPAFVDNKNAYTETFNIGAGFSATQSISSTKFSNTNTAPANSIGELVSHTGTSSNAVGFSGNIGAAVSNSSSLWIDINGDGLTDFVKDGVVLIYNGKSFIQETSWNQGNELFKNVSKSIGGGLGVNLWGGSWVMGTGINHSNSRVETVFIDINGDGLPDKVYSDTQDNKKYYVNINTGDSFSKDAILLGEIEYANVGLNNRQNTQGINVFGTVCLVVFKVKLCVSLGGNKDKTLVSQNVDLRDFTGDGLPDIVISDDENNLSYIENKAGRFNLLRSITNPLGGSIGLTYMDSNISDRKKIGNTYQMPFSKQLLVRASVKINNSDTTNPADILEFNNNTVQYSDFEYQNGVQDRRERSFLGFGTVKTIQGYKGITQVTEYETNFTDPTDFYVPYNDTKVRKYFYKKGLAKSTYTLDSIGRERQRTNFIYRYFDQTAENYILTENQTEPIFKDIGRIIPFLYKTQTIATEFSGTNSHSKTTTATINEYDKFGNVTKYTDLGSSPTNTSDDIKVSIAYHPVTAQNVGGIPQQQLVTNSANTLLRKSETAINAKGDITSIKRFIGSNFVEYNYEYDTYGNLKKSILPKNIGQAETDRMYYKYDFDPTYNTYITKISDARGLSSTTTYDTDYLFGVPTTITDTNNAIAYYTYDAFGRLREYRAPTATSWTIKLNYYKAGDFNSRVAVTEKKAPIVNGVPPTLNYFSSVYVNNWGEELSTKKLYGGVADNYIYTYTKSPLQDHRGRTMKSFINKLATQENGSILDAMQNFKPQNSQTLNADEFSDFSISYKYDELDRPTKAIQNGVITNTGTANLTTETQYGFGADRDGNIQFTKKTISPKGLESLVYNDQKGRTSATKQIGDNKNLWVSYSYDLLNQLTEVKDQNSNKIEFTYDQLGRRISEKHMDAGLMTYEYDYNNNLIYMDNSVLRDLNQKIGYQYKFNKLTKIVYPNYNVTYEYGAANAGDNGAGRLIKQTDHTGIQFFKYNQLGQIVENRRFLVAPDVDAKLFKTSYTYDLYNRINKIVYPDNEEVFYNYTPFGLLNNLKSKAPGSTTQEPIISEILYNYNEQTLETTAGNGTKTQYDYDSWGRLEEMALQGISTQLKKNQYLFDKDNNIASVTTAVPMSGTLVQGDISIAADKTFEYDGFNRLKKSIIKATGKTNRTYYELDMAYTDMHGIANKDSRWKNFEATGCQNPIAAGNKSVYNYNDLNHPNAVSSIEFNSPNSGGIFTTPWDCGNLAILSTLPTTELYTYDANGNMTKVENGNDLVLGSDPVENVKRKLFWDAQNRLKGITEQNAFHHYVYDEDGQRALKSEGVSRGLRTDGNLRPGPNPTIMGPYNYYPNGYMVMNERQVSKHYYIGSNKIAARVSETPSHGFLAPSNSELTDLSNALKIEADDIVSEAGLNPILWNPIFIGGIDFESEETCAAEILAEAEKYPPKSVCYKKLMNGYNDALINGTKEGSFCTFWHNFQLDDCMADQPTEESRYQTYWVHPDHLGSSSVITNQSGATTNWYEYMPFGEMLMEQSSNEYNNPYKYNGKELDEATQLYYYGARYMDPKTSIWLSVDPLAVYSPVMETEFYGDGQHNGGVFYSGNLNPYIYTYQNPIKYIDPNGKQTEWDQGMAIQSYTWGWIGDARAGVLNLVSRATNSTDRFEGNGFFGYYKIVDKNSPTLFEDVVNATIGVATSKAGIKSGNIIAAVKTGKGTVREFFGLLKEGSQAEKLATKLEKYGKDGKLPIPSIENKSQFVKKEGELIHKETGSIYRKSNTQHRGIDGEYKIWPKGTKDFGTTSKTSGIRITTDNKGKIIGH